MDAPDDEAIVLRSASVRDLPTILRGERQYMADVEPAHADEWEGALDRNLALWIDNLERTVVLEVDGEPAAYAMWTLAAGTATVVTINVSDAHRRRGLARRLLARVTADARSAGAQRLTLGVQQDNPARWLYDRTGFTRTGRDGDYLLYELVLTAG